MHAFWYLLSFLFAGSTSIAMSAGFRSGILGVPSSLCKVSASGRVVLTRCLLAFPWWFLLGLRPGVPHTLPSCVQGLEQEPTASSAHIVAAVDGLFFALKNASSSNVTELSADPHTGVFCLLTPACFELLPTGLPCRSFTREHHRRSRAWANARRVSGERSHAASLLGEDGPFLSPHNFSLGL